MILCYILFLQGLGYISIRVSNSAQITDHTLSDQCALWMNDTFPGASCLLLKCDHIKSGRYVSIQRLAGTYVNEMTLCEVMVMSARDSEYNY